MVPVQSEQCSPPIRARIFLRSGLADGSSLHGSNAEAVAIDNVIENLRLSLVLAAEQNRRPSAGALAYRGAPNNPKARPLDRVNEVLFLHGLRIVKHTRLPIAKRDGCHPHSGLLFNEGFDGVSAAIAAHTFDFEDGSLHSMLRLRMVLAMFSPG
jgi:hypothetical protein